jgi:hypothetical protein
MILQDNFIDWLRSEIDKTKNSLHTMEIQTDKEVEMHNVTVGYLKALLNVKKELGIKRW